MSRVITALHLQCRNTTTTKRINDTNLADKNKVRTRFLLQDRFPCKKKKTHRVKALCGLLFICLMFISRTAFFPNTYNIPKLSMCRGITHDRGAQSLPDVLYGCETWSQTLRTNRSIYCLRKQFIFILRIL
jgi:hypothetical protein